MISKNGEHVLEDTRAELHDLMVGDAALAEGVVVLELWPMEGVVVVMVFRPMVVMLMVVVIVLWPMEGVLVAWFLRRPLGNKVPPWHRIGNMSADRGRAP